MRTPTVKLRHKKKGHRVITVDLKQYSTDLGKARFKNYELVGESRGDSEAESSKETSSNVSVISGNGENQESETSGLAQTEGDSTEEVETVLTTTEDGSGEPEPEKEELTDPASASVDAVIETVAETDTESAEVGGSASPEDKTPVHKSRARPAKPKS